MGIYELKKSKSINVFGKTCPVKITSLDDNFLGLFYYDEFRIEISDKCPKEKFDEIFIHEAVHAVFNRSSLNQCAISHDAQEIICDQVAKFITENFKLTKK